MRRMFNKQRGVIAVASVVLATAGCSSTGEWRDGAADEELGVYETSAAPARANSDLFPVQTGLASWDGIQSASGMTAAHARLPIDSMARVTNAQTGQSAMVRVTERLEPGSSLAIELSHDAAAAVGVLENGRSTVIIDPLDLLRGNGAAETQAQIYRTSSPGSAFEPAYALPAYSPVETVRVNSPAPIAAPVRPRVATDYSSSIVTGAIPGRQATPAPTVRRGMSLVGANYVQVGSFRDPANAYRMVRRLEAEGLGGGVYGGAFVETARIKGATYHRVRLGPIGQTDTARRALRDARALGHTGAQIVRP
ncbi:MAG: SPOR domain-containing protein [Rhodobacteraceae bacterium]|nr:SPOR domain-containing protein [Paracoccaceae bacterium]